MAASFIAASSTPNHNTATTPKAMSAAWTLADFLLVTAGIENDGVNDSLTITGGPASGWTPIEHIGAQSGAGTQCTLYAWVCTAGATGSGNVSLVLNPSSASQFGGQCYQFRGAALGAHISNATTAKTITITKGGGPFAVWAGYDFAAGAQPTVFTPSTNHNNRSNGVSASHYTWEESYWSVQGALSGSQTYGVATGFGAGPISKVAIEIVDAPAGFVAKRQPSGLVAVQRAALR